jgi:hypothetical protein
MTNPITDRAAGVLAGAVDVAQGVTHEARGWHPSPAPDGREQAAHARWQAGLPARNSYERDAFASFEASLTAGMNHLDWLGKQATAIEAARGAEAKGPEAGQ